MKGHDETYDDAKLWKRPFSSFSRVQYSFSCSSVITSGSLVRGALPAGVCGRGGCCAIVGTGFSP